MLLEHAVKCQDLCKVNICGNVTDEVGGGGGGGGGDGKLLFSCFSLSELRAANIRAEAVPAPAAISHGRSFLLRFPVIVLAWAFAFEWMAGGGGREMRVFHVPANLEAKLREVRQQGGEASPAKLLFPAWLVCLFFFPTSPASKKKKKTQKQLCCFS